MNFLSHYYFDRHSSALKILGCLLPDLIRNAVKLNYPSPLRKPENFINTEFHEIFNGWKNHILVDKYFHASEFFVVHTQAIKEQIFAVTNDSEIRPSFLAHISLELILDHLLIAHNYIQVDKLYLALQESDKEITTQFLHACEIENPEPILNFIDSFKASRYLLSYQKIENLAYALNRICMRLWPAGMQQAKVNLLFAVLEEYIAGNGEEMLKIFHEIEIELNLKPTIS